MKVKTKTFYTFYQISAIQSSLENDMELLCLTGVEDKLQVTLVCYREDLTLFVLGYELYVRMLSISLTSKRDEQVRDSYLKLVL